MKLLSPNAARLDLKKQNEELVDTNIRLRKYWNQIVKKLNELKESYDTDKVQKLEEFEKFCKEIQEKRSVLLKEYVLLEKEIESKKDILYGLIEKQDRLEERVHEINEMENKLDLREAFVEDLEQKWRAKTT